MHRFTKSVLGTFIIGCITFAMNASIQEKRQPLEEKLMKMKQVSIRSDHMSRFGIKKDN